MSKYKIIGLVIIALEIAMLFFGAAMFSYQGKPLNPIIDKLGMYSFFFWLPTIAIGVGLMFLKNRQKTLNK